MSDKVSELIKVHDSGKVVVEYLDATGEVTERVSFHKSARGARVAGELLDEAGDYLASQAEEAVEQHINDRTSRLESLACDQ